MKILLGVLLAPAIFWGWVVTVTYFYHRFKKY